MEKRTAVIDRLTENRAFLEDESGSVRAVPRGTLPPDAREGDVLVYSDGAWHTDARETDLRRDRVKKRLERLIK